MAYTNNIPNATDRISDSQAPIKDNFGSIDTVVSVNHVTFDDASGDQGKHKHASFPEQPASPATLANEVTLFSRESTKTGVAELAVRKESNGEVYEFTGALKTQNGWTMLPSGILLKWMYESDLRGNVTTNWPVAGTIPVFSSIFNVQVTPEQSGTSDSDVALRVSAKTATSVRTYGSKRVTFPAAATSALAGYIFGIGTPVL